MSQRSTPPAPAAWRTLIFKNRGLLLVPVALVLVVFGKPSVKSIVIGLAVALAGEMIRVWAVGYSGVTTRSDVVTAPELVTAGPYGYIRNPLYVGNAMTALGFWVAFSGSVTLAQSAMMLAVVVLFVGGVYAVIIPLEEAYLAKTFGAPYQRYLQSVPPVLPLRGGLPMSERRGRWRWEVILRAEIITLAYFVLMTAAVLIKLRRG